MFASHLLPVSFSDHRMVRSTILGLSLGVLAACSSWVQLSPEAESINLLTASQASQCRRIGTANVNALDEIGFIDRSATRLQDELVKLAKNEAARLGGTSVVPESTIEEGRQTFGVFFCR